MKKKQYDHEILLLQGGGALGSYHCGIYEALAEEGMMPAWVVGISIGAINSAIIAGNPPERRIERLREFWERSSSTTSLMPPSMFDSDRSMQDHLSVLSAMTFGIPGFFAPRMPSPFLHRAGARDAFSFYDTSPLKKTLEELVDFDLLNNGKTRLSLGAVNVRSGQSVYFDTRTTRIRPEHVMASGALPPGFPGVKIDGEVYWDGGLVSNTPLTYVADERPLTTALIVQVNLFPAQGPIPQNLEQVMERMKDIQYCSKQRFSTEYLQEIGELRAAFRRVLPKLPPELQSDPDVQRLARHADAREWTIAFFTDTFRSQSGQWKDVDFSPTTVKGRWTAGVEAVRRSLTDTDWTAPTTQVPGIRVFHLPPPARQAAMAS